MTRVLENTSDIYILKIR